jgi:hypothetical protein
MFIYNENLLVFQKKTWRPFGLRVPFKYAGMQQPIHYIPGVLSPLAMIELLNA